MICFRSVWEAKKSNFINYLPADICIYFECKSVDCISLKKEKSKAQNQKLPQILYIVKSELIFCV